MPFHRNLTVRYDSITYEETSMSFTCMSKFYGLMKFANKTCEFVLYHIDEGLYVR